MLCFMKDCLVWLTIGYNSSGFNIIKIIVWQIGKIKSKLFIVSTHTQCTTASAKFVMTVVQYYTVHNKKIYKNSKYLKVDKTTLLYSNSSVWPNIHNPTCNTVL